MSISSKLIKKMNESNPDMNTYEWRNKFKRELPPLYRLIVKAQEIAEDKTKDLTAINDVLYDVLRVAKRIYEISSHYEGGVSISNLPKELRG